MSIGLAFFLVAAIDTVCPSGTFIDPSVLPVVATLEQVRNLYATGNPALQQRATQLYEQMKKPGQMPMGNGTVYYSQFHQEIQTWVTQQCLDVAARCNVNNVQGNCGKPIIDPRLLMPTADTCQQNAEGKCEFHIGPGAE